MERNRGRKFHMNKRPKSVKVQFSYITTGNNPKVNLNMSTWSSIPTQSSRSKAKSGWFWTSEARKIKLTWDKIISNDGLLASGNSCSTLAVMSEKLVSLWTERSLTIPGNAQTWLGQQDCHIFQSASLHRQSCLGSNINLNHIYYQVFEIRTNQKRPHLWSCLTQLHMEYSPILQKQVCSLSLKQDKKGKS